ncbi:hypothetical protein [Agromyces archimandritae]|uniref:Uncharacterized protein n=1 Tax=Agromyces archimandritae TaxID=2781962 RepID=A0A975IMD4_9MICO|nr:hypothetical protein [Agromyces archimandritae]QTX03335.1 hypothetical protein G127AT_08035 [Agromyces archimandritae]
MSEEPLYSPALHVISWVALVFATVPLASHRHTVLDRTLSGPWHFSKLFLSKHLEAHLRTHFFLAAAASLTLLLSGCALSAPAIVEAAPKASAPGDRLKPDESLEENTAAEPPEPSAVDLACSSLGEPVSLAHNAWLNFEDGALTEKQRNSDLNRASELFRGAEASGTPAIDDAVLQILACIDESSPDETGRPYDPGTDEFFRLNSAIGKACADLGSHLYMQGG